MQSKNNSFLLSFLNGSIFGGAKERHTILLKVQKNTPAHFTGLA
jgi:hypothetical protein